MPYVIACVLLVVILVVYARHLRVRRAIATTIALADGVDVSPRTTAEWKRVSTAVDALNLDELTAMRLEDTARGLMPQLSAAQPKEQPMAPITRLFQELEQRTVVVAGVEQVLVMGAAHSGVMEQLTQLWAGALVPQAMHSAAGAVVEHALHGALSAADMTAAAYLVAQVGNNVAASLAPAIGKGLFDTPDFMTMLDHIAIHDVPASGAIADFISTQADILKIGVETAAKVLGLSGLGESLQQSAIDHLMSEHGLTAYQAIWEHFYDQVSVTDHVNHALSAAELGNDTLMGHFAVFTLMIHGWQELNRWQQGITPGGRAVGNVALDVTGRTVGGFLGAALGSVVPGPGTFIGGAIGSVLGGLWAKHEKEGHLRHAQSHQREVQDHLRQTEETAARAAYTQASVQTNVAWQQYVAQIQHVPRLEPLLDRAAQGALLDVRRASMIWLRQAQREVALATKLVTVKANGKPRARVAFVPVPAQLAQRTQRAHARLDSAQLHLPTPAYVREHPYAALNMLASMSHDLLPGAQPPRPYWQCWRRSLTVARRKTTGYRASVTSWYRSAAATYEHSAQSLRKQIELAMQGYVTAVEPVLQTLAVAEEDVRKEEARLGRKRKR